MNEENVKAEKKPRSVRVDDATFNRFKALCEDLGGQQECLNNLLTAYEVVQAKETAPEMSTGIDTLVYHLNQIQQSFLCLIDVNKTTEERVKEKVAISLETKDNTITDLQKRLKATEDKLEDYGQFMEEQTEKNCNALEALEDEKIKLNEELTQAAETNSTLKKTIEDKENIIAAKETLISNLTAQLDKLQELDSLKAEIEKLKFTISGNANTISELESRIQTRETKINELSKDIEHAEKIHNQALEVAEQQKKAAVSSAIAETKSDYIDKVLKLQEENNDLKDKIRELEKLIPEQPPTPPAIPTPPESVNND